ncbi:MAG: hypothetical protein HYX41_04085 [Bdellovibrio sp.]|nr:hypothetical protein [Bdellovibrio sp.]
MAYVYLMSLGQAVNLWYERKVVERSFLGQFLRKLRRFYLGTFKPEYIQKAIEETRQGECHRCGLCCELIYRCPFLGKDSQNLPYCRVYGDLRPANCKNYPFDSKDAEIDQCGYSFKPKVDSKPIVIQPAAHKAGTVEVEKKVIAEDLRAVHGATPETSQNTSQRASGV